MTTVLASVAATVTAVVAPTVALASNSSMESQFIAKMNAAREANGLAPYTVASDLTSIAREHSNAMASQGRLYHNPNLTSQVQNWQAVGENVGDGPTVDDIHSAFMHSPEHRANILDHDYTQVGVGVTVDSSGQIWVTEDFREPMHSTRSTSTTHHSTSSGTTAPTHHYASSSGTTGQVASHPAAAPVRRVATPAATPAAVLKARLSKLRTAAAKAQSADPVSQAFDYLTSLTTLSG